MYCTPLRVAGRAERPGNDRGLTYQLNNASIFFSSAKIGFKNRMLMPPFSSAYNGAHRPPLK